MTLRLKCEDATQYLPSGRPMALRWYVINDSVIDNLTNKPVLEMIGTRAECEAFINRKEKE